MYFTGIYNVLKGWPIIVFNVLIYDPQYGGSGGAVTANIYIYIYIRHPITSTNFVGCILLLLWTSPVCYSSQDDVRVKSFIQEQRQPRNIRRWERNDTWFSPVECSTTGGNNGIILGRYCIGIILNILCKENLLSQSSFVKYGENRATESYLVAHPTY